VAKQKRAQRHHTVPRFHLRGFADKDDMLRQIDLRNATRTPVSVGDASVVKNFYTVVLEGGTRSDLWERKFAELENLVAPMVRRATTMATWSPQPDERNLLSSWIGLQMVRGTGHRRAAADMKAMMLAMQVGMGGLAYLRHVMTEGLGRPVTAEEAQIVWDDLHQPGGPRMDVTGAEQVQTIQQMITQATEHIETRSWHRVRFARKTLVVSDAPVVLMPADDHPDFLGVGLLNAGSVLIALDRHTLLWLDDSAFSDGDHPPTVALASLYNRTVVAGAERFVFTHPEDPDPTLDLPLPAPAPRMPEPTNLNTFANPDRPLEDVLTQIANHNLSDTASLIANYAWPLPGYQPPPLPGDQQPV